MSWHHWFATGHWFQVTNQAFVHARHAGQIVQDALIDSQRTRCYRRTSSQFNQPPVAQGRVRRQSAPVRIRQGGQRQTERGMRTLAVALRRKALRGKRAVEFDAGAEQQRGALERRQAEVRAELIQSGWCRQAASAILKRLLQRAAVFCLRTGLFGMVVECRAHDGQLRHEALLVGLGPSRRLGSVRLHGSTTV